MALISVAAHRQDLNQMAPSPLSLLFAAQLSNVGIWYALHTSQNVIFIHCSWERPQLGAGIELATSVDKVTSLKFDTRISKNDDK